MAAISTAQGGHDKVFSWSVEYAKSGRSKCQATGVNIEQGSVRIGKEVDSSFKPGTTMFVWYKPGPLFDQFRKGSENKPRITDVTAVVGFTDLKPSDRTELEALVSAEASFREGLSQAEEGTEYFVYPKHGAFWSIVVAGSTTRVKWGKVGEEAVLSEKSHADDAAATKFRDKMIREKTNKGYIASKPGDPMPAVVGADEDGDGSSVPSTTKAEPAPAETGKEKGKGKAKKSAEKRKAPATAAAAAAAAAEEEEVDNTAVAAAEAMPTAKSAKAAKGASASASAKAATSSPTALTAASTSSDTVFSWAVEYAKSNRSTCQASKEKIEQGAVRIGKEVDNTFKPGSTMFLWHKSGPLFDQFRKGSENKPRITDVTAVVGFADLKPKDQKELEALVSAETSFRESLTRAEEGTEHFTMVKEGAEVFWSIVVAGSTTRVKWGKVGEEAVLSEKSHADDAAATKFKDKMIREKLGKGYVKKDAP